MSEPTVKPIDRLHGAARCFVQWLQTRRPGGQEGLARLQEQVEKIRREGGDYRPKLWDKVFRELFDEWSQGVAAEIRRRDLPEIVDVILEEDRREPLAGKQRLKQRIGELRKKITRARQEDEEFESDLADMDNSLLSYQQVLDQFGDDPRLDEVLRRGVHQALVTKERDLQWLDDLLERLRSGRDAGL